MGSEMCIRDRGRGGRGGKGRTRSRSRNKKVNAVTEPDQPVEDVDAEDSDAASGNF